ANASLTVNGSTGVYDGAAHGATGSATGVNAEDLSALLNLGSSFTAVPGGSANWTFAGNNNYNAANGSANIVITQAALSVTAGDASRSCGQTNPVVAATYGGFVNGQPNPVLDGTLELPTSALTNSAVGSYD